VHVLAEQRGRHGRHGEGRLGRRGAQIGGRDQHTVRRRINDGKRLAAGRQAARLEHAAERVGQA
jgi:hypothetical protein